MAYSEDLYERGFNFKYKLKLISNFVGFYLKMYFINNYIKNSKVLFIFIQMIAIFLFSSLIYLKNHQGIFISFLNHLIYFHSWIMVFGKCAFNLFNCEILKWNIYYMQFATRRATTIEKKIWANIEKLF